MSPSTAYWWEELVRDALKAVRDLRRRPGFAFTAVLSLGVAMAALTVVASVADGFLFRSLPVEAPDELVALQEDRSGRNTMERMGLRGVSYQRYQVYAAGAGPFMDGLAAQDYQGFSLGIPGSGARDAFGVLASSNYFRVLGVRPALGRFFEPDPLGRGAEGEVVISHHLWREMGGGADVLGRSLLVDGAEHVVVGVTPAGFHGTLLALAPDLWVPVSTRARGPEGSRRVWLTVFGRLGPGVPMDDASARIDALVPDNPAEYDNATVHSARFEPLTPIPRAFRGAALGFVGLLVLAGVLVLVVAAINVGGMLLARAVGRRREVAVRLALGAGRPRLVRQFVTESLVLFALAGGVGVVAGAWLGRILGALRPPVPVRLELDLDPSWSVVAVLALVILGAGVLFGMIPALRSTRPDLARDLREGARTESPGSARLRSAFVVAQIGVSVVLLVAAGWFVRTIHEAGTMDTGMRVRGLAAAVVEPGAGLYADADADALVAELVERLRARGDVEGVGLARAAPLMGSTNSGAARLTDGEPRELQVLEARVSPGWLETAGAELVRGRGFLESDREGGERLAVVNETMARRLWPDGDALGRRFTLFGSERTVVGVAGDGRYADLAEEPRPFVYALPERPLGSGAWVFVRAGNGEAAVALRALAEELRGLDPRVAPQQATTLEDRIEVQLAPQRVGAWLIGVFSVVGVLLALVGLFGLVSFHTARRVREIGIRMALGAAPGRVLRSVLYGALGLAGGGALVGLVGVWATAGLVRRFVFGVGVADPWVALGVSGVLVGVALLASWVPARRAAAVAPARVLRTE